MRIGVFGATGVIGSAIVAEAKNRNHQVTAFTRSATRVPSDSDGLDWQVADPLDPAAASAAVAGLDVVVGAINAGNDIPNQIAHPEVLPNAARVLLKALEQRPATRLVWVGGGGSLELRPGVRLIDDAEFSRNLATILNVPPEYRKVVLAQAEVLDICRLSNRLWTYLSPSARLIVSGERTGRYRLGGDQILSSIGDISAQDLAVALVDEIEVPRHIQRRFTVAA